MFLVTINSSLPIDYNNKISRINNKNLDLVALSFHCTLSLLASLLMTMHEYFFWLIFGYDFIVELIFSKIIITTNKGRRCCKKKGEKGKGKKVNNS